MTDATAAAVLVVLVLAFSALVSVEVVSFWLCNAHNERVRVAPLAPPLLHSHSVLVQRYRLPWTITLHAFLVLLFLTGFTSYVVLVRMHFPSRSSIHVRVARRRSAG